MSGWVWAAASVRGTSHVNSNTRKQDAFRCATVDKKKGVLLSVVCDGAGSASMGGQGASLATRVVMGCARQYFAKTTALPADEEIWSWIDNARDRIFVAAEKRELSARDFATTVILLIATSKGTVCGHIGDGAAVIKPSDGDAWTALSWPAHGEYASATFFLTDDPTPQLRVSRTDQRMSAAAIFTDGIERLALDFASKQPHQPFFRNIIGPLNNCKAKGSDKPLSSALAGFLNSERVNARTDDDKTLVLAVAK